VASVKLNEISFRCGAMLKLKIIKVVTFVTLRHLAPTSPNVRPTTNNPLFLSCYPVRQIRSCSTGVHFSR